MVAHLSAGGYEGFEEQVGGTLVAFIPAADFDRAALEAILAPYNLTYEASTIEPTNWNALWESNFEPVLVDDFCGIRADFHETLAGKVKYEILITPKMSFGTGHHATTASMIRLMRDIDFSGKQVFDFGTGTGILAILAEQLAAAKVDAIDNDEWAVNNTMENIANNNAVKTKVWQADNLDHVEPGYDIILANINRHILLQFMPRLQQLLRAGGKLLLSGILSEDESLILASAVENQFNFECKVMKDNWLAMQFEKK